MNYLNIGFVILASIIFFTYFNSSAQPSNYPLQLEPYESKIVDVELSAQELYTKSINWVKETFNEPSEVLKMSIENEKIRILAYSKIDDVRNWEYDLTISFKDGKYKIDYTIISLVTVNQVRTIKTPLNQLFKNGHLINFYKKHETNLVDAINSPIQKHYKSLFKSSDW